MSRGIPFNRPHGIKIHKVEENAVITTIPKKKINHNHIQGVHACGLATAAEFCSGLMLLRNLDARQYRLIMQKLEVEYYYQAKYDCFARFELDRETLINEILKPLETEDAVFYTCEVPVLDAKNNHICTAFTRWQLKPWSKVKTK